MYIKNSNSLNINVSILNRILNDTLILIYEQTIFLIYYSYIMKYSNKLWMIYYLNENINKNT